MLLIVELYVPEKIRKKLLHYYCYKIKKANSASDANAIIVYDVTRELLIRILFTRQIESRKNCFFLLGAREASFLHVISEFKVSDIFRYSDRFVSYLTTLSKIRCT